MYLYDSNDFEGLLDNNIDTHLSVAPIGNGNLDSKRWINRHQIILVEEILYICAEV